MARQRSDALMDKELADVLVDRRDIEDAPQFPADERMVLRLQDLVEDANGEVVLFNDSHLARLALATDVAPVERGEAGPHVTAAGEDVSGFHFIAFGNGLKLFFQEGLDLVVTPEHASV